MSRFLKIMIVLLAIAAMAAPSVFAENRLSLSGQMRVRGWYQDFDTDQTNSYMDQRLRMFGNIAVADGVKIQFRTDITENTWGNGGNAFGSGRTGVQQWDRAYIDLTQGAVHFRAGQQYAGFGLAGQTVNSEDTGLKFDYKVSDAVKLSAFWFLGEQNKTAKVDAVNYKIDQATGTIVPVTTPVAAADASDKADAYVYAANLGFKNDAYRFDLFGGGQTNESAIGENVYMISADMVTNIQAVKLQAEFNYFTGDASESAGNTVDAIGTQFWLDASMAATETVTVGGEFYYALGTDDPTEQQYTYIGNDYNGYDPLFNLGGNMYDEQNMFGRPFDLATSLIAGGFGKANGMSKAEVKGFQGNSGAVGARLYGKVKASDALELGASVAYMEPEEDVDYLDSSMFYAINLKYKLMANTTIESQLQYVDVDGDLDKDTAVMGGVGLFVNF